MTTDTAQLRELLAKATQGDFHISSFEILSDGEQCVVMAVDGFAVAYFMGRSREENEANAAAFVALHNAALLDELDRLRAENERLATDHQSYCKSWNMRKRMNVLEADLSEERHAHNKTQFDLAEAEANINLKAEFIEATINQLAQRDQELEEARKERALIVAWLRSMDNGYPESAGYSHAADAIERGEHRSKSDD